MNIDVIKLCFIASCHKKVNFKWLQTNNSNNKFVLYTRVLVIIMYSEVHIIVWQHKNRSKWLP